MLVFNQGADISTISEDTINQLRELVKKTKTKKLVDVRVGSYQM